MKLVVGLGNPGAGYARTRHNVGFWIVERLADRHGLRFGEKGYKGKAARGSVGSESVMLLEPETFMNLSGESVGRARRDLGLSPPDVLVACDDLDLPVGRVRLRDGGGTGGHRGVESIAQVLGGKGFPRLRVGIGRDARDAVDYVLDTPSAEEQVILDAAVERAADAVEVWLAQGIAQAMNQFNADPASSASPGQRRPA